MTESFEFEWDLEKAHANLRKHNVPFLKATEVFSDPMRLERPDEFEEYEEERWITLGLAEQTVLVVIFTLRDRHIRLISARRATYDEQRAYWSGYIPS